jgi:hypothetical protein
VAGHDRAAVVCRPDGVQQNRRRGHIEVCPGQDVNQVRSGEAVEAMVHEQRHPGVEADRTRLESTDREVEARQAAWAAVEAEDLTYDTEAESASTVGQDDCDAAEGPVWRVSCKFVRPRKSVRAG